MDFNSIKKQFDDFKKDKEISDAAAVGAAIGVWVGGAPGVLVGGAIGWAVGEVLKSDK